MSTSARQLTKSTESSGASVDQLDASTRSTPEIRRIQAQALREAADIALATASPLSPEMWNLACQRIQQVLLAEAAKLEGVPLVRN